MKGTPSCPKSKVRPRAKPLHLLDQMEAAAHLPPLLCCVMGQDERVDNSAAIQFVDGIRQRGRAGLAAEGIETQAEPAAVVEAGMTTGQGYLLGRTSVHPLDWSAWIIQTEAVSARPSGSGPDL
jgi:hypothetical protein